LLIQIQNHGRFEHTLYSRIDQSKGSWAAQSVKRLALDFGSGPHLGVVVSGPALGSMLGVEPTWDSLSQINK